MSRLFGYDTEADMTKALARTLLDHELQQWARGGGRPEEAAESYIELIERVIASLDEQAATEAYAAIVEYVLGGEVPLSEAEAARAGGPHEF